MNPTKDIREIYFADEFKTFYNSLPEKVRAKIDFVMEMVKTEYVVNSKFVKHLENTDLYEMRISVATNEYRTILFAIDNMNLILATRIIVLNGFLKKSTKDYKKYIKAALKILNEMV